jgi:hypothetical protein
MKNQTTSIYSAFLILMILHGCQSLSYDPKSLYINQVIGEKSTMSIQLEDKSKFSIDIKNFFGRHALFTKKRYAVDFSRE